MVKKIHSRVRKKSVRDIALQIERIRNNNAANEGRLSRAEDAAFRYGQNILRSQINKTGFATTTKRVPRSVYMGLANG